MQRFEQAAPLGHVIVVAAHIWRRWPAFGTAENAQQYLNCQKADQRKTQPIVQGHIRETKRQDQNQAQSMARTFANLRATDILDEVPAEARLGQPTLAVEATLLDGSTHVIKVGAEAEEAVVYLGRSTDALGFKLRDSALAPLKRTQAELRDKSLFGFEREAVTALTVRRGAAETRMSKGEGGWQVDKAAGAPPAAASIEGAVNSLSTLRAIAFKPGTSAEEAGLTGDALQVRIGLSGGGEATLVLGGEAQGGQFYAQADGGEVVTVRGYILKNLEKLLEG